jgi:hypothetical protein
MHTQAQIQSGPLANVWLHSPCHTALASVKAGRPTFFGSPFGKKNNEEVTVLVGNSVDIGHSCRFDN